jgi:hypothetical protein
LACPGKNRRNLSKNAPSSVPIFYIEFAIIKKFFYINFVIGYEADMKMGKIAFLYLIN